MEIAAEGLERFVEVLMPHMNGLQRRVVAGATAEMLGRGGKTAVAAASGMSRNTVIKAEPSRLARRCSTLWPPTTTSSGTFGHFLQEATDVERFAKLPRQFRFTIEYTDAATNLRYYEPDFVAVDRAGVHYVIETKGQENIDVAHKDRAATILVRERHLAYGHDLVLLKGTSGRF